ncbi:hypothetical protein K435DRAFT_648665 [Dendrothele bispora CBS 962.96]|uniref:Ubiquitin-like domain-containing protein n=1 Tax=Dendrothele bispora (strain CBS 962.96) TaxID=1314807 RepID=A0A4S8MQT2_DENBC|nr:hypothetical protein K435DRAFT_648665 [Dendrothele bispora CBS 962.96]
MEGASCSTCFTRLALTALHLDICYGLTLEVESSDTIDNVKATMLTETQDKEGAPSTSSILFSPASDLRAVGSRSLSGYSIQKESTLHLILRLRRSGTLKVSMKIIDGKKNKGEASSAQASF